jgi:predicted transcriptional regulator
LQRNTSDRDGYLKLTVKLTVLLMLYNGFSRQAIADNLGIAPSTVTHYRSQFAESPDFDTYLITHYKPCEGKLTEAQQETVPPNT